MPTIEIEGTTVSYQADGAGPGLVLVHGTGGDGESNWGNVVERFTPRWKVVRPDYAGSGKTVDGGAPLSIAQLAAQVVASARAAGATPFDLVGFSLGASLAAYIAAEYPQEVRALVLLAGFASAGDGRMQLEFGLWRDLIHSDRRAMARLLLLTGLSPDFLAGLSPRQIEENIDAIIAGNQWEGMGRQVALNLTLDVSGQVRRIAKPTLVIGCLRDHMVPPAHARALAASIAGARYAELACGHLATLERPDEFTQLVTDFLLAGGR
ncbi:alpha/beta fold hydrolase [Acerihabitans arboris]|uniref:Alpha/beta fold hydrolase n=1 Tax=Acerihabitans arboris TaxID=2691583 RepID=A0A845SK88_9GAMM|nr:alpha/beta hydrolase [Acerihabitans arboris]NDL63008.1 alpha/beta fold hydrolase [Acerihabitans arboris]